MAGSLIRRLHMTQLDVEVVLAGGVFRNDDAAFYARLEAGITRVASRARTIKLDAPPVAGAVLLALDELARRGLSGPHRRRQPIAYAQLARMGCLSDAHLANP